MLNFILYSKMLIDSRSVNKIDNNLQADRFW